MSVIGSQHGMLPGLSTAYLTYENVLAWGGEPRPRIISGQRLVSTTVDARSTPTTRLQVGLVLGKIAATGKWTHYSASATDGSQIAQGVLIDSLMMTNHLTDSAEDRIVAVLVGGPVRAGNLGGLDQKARGDMFGRFIFDDDLFGNRTLYRRETTKTANYTVTAADVGTDFIANGNAAVVFTLPTLAPGLYYRFRNIVGQNMTIAGATNTIVGFNNATANNVIFNTTNNLIGACVEVFANAAGTKWYVNNLSPGNTITFT